MDGYGHSNPSDIDQKRQDVLARELARVFHDPEDARRLAMRAGIPRSEIPAFSRPSVFWSRVIEQAQNGGLEGGMETIRTMAAEKFPGNAVFAPPRAIPLLPQIVHGVPQRLLTSTGGLHNVLVGMLLMTVLVLGAAVLVLWEHPSLWIGTVDGFGDGDDAPSEEDATPSKDAPILLGDAGASTSRPKPARWWCVSFQSPHAHSKSHRQTTCRAKREHCMKVRAHQSSRDRRPSDCLGVPGTHPAQALKTSQDRWSRSESPNGGWLYPYGDLVPGRG